MTPQNTTGSQECPQPQPFLQSRARPAFACDEKTAKAALQSAFQDAEHKPQIEDFRFAQLPAPGFWHGPSPLVPKGFYTEPVNQRAAQNRFGLISGEECQTCLSEAEREEILRFAIGLKTCGVNFHYADTDGWKNSLLPYFGAPGLPVSSLDADIEGILRYRSVSKGGFWADQSCLYVDSEGFFRVRGLVFIRAKTEIGHFYPKLEEDQWLLKAMEMSFFRLPNGALRVAALLPFCHGEVRRAGEIEWLLQK